MPIYMKWGGDLVPRIKGDATDDNHQDWIELLDGHFGVHGQGNRPPEQGPFAMYEFIGTKMADRSSPQLFRESTAGQGETVQIEVVTEEDGKLTVRRSIKLTDTMISSLTVSQGTGRQDQPVETLTLTFASIEWGSAAAVTPHLDAPAQWGVSP